MGLDGGAHGKRRPLHLFSSACQEVPAKSDSPLPSSSDYPLGTKVGGEVKVCAEGGGDWCPWKALSCSVNRGWTGGFRAESDELETDSGTKLEGSLWRLSL